MGHTLKLLYLSTIILCSCATGSADLEMAIARRSIEAAREKGAEVSVCASRNYFDAVSFFQKGKRNIVETRISRAKDNFIKSRKHAEKAEEQAYKCKE